MDFLRTTLKSVDDNGTWTSVASSPSIDRDGERVLPRSLTWRTPTIPVHCGHAFKVEQLVGRAKPYYDQNGFLLVDGKFNSTDLAQTTRRAVLDGSLDSMSVVMVDVKRAEGKDGVTEITGGELVACDWVTIPSNVEARVLAARAWNPTVAEARAMAHQAMLDLARLDLDEAGAVLRRLDKAAGVSPAEFRSALGDAQQLLRDLERTP